MLPGCYWPHQFGGPLLKSYVRGMSLPLINFFLLLENTTGMKLMKAHPFAF